MQTAKIISDGTVEGTKVLVDGVALKGVSRIEIDPIVPGGAVLVRVTQLFQAELDVATMLPEKAE